MTTIIEPIDRLASVPVDATDDKMELELENGQEDQETVDDREPIDQSWTVWRIATERTPETWEGVFKTAENELKDISVILDKQEAKYGSCYPMKCSIFRAFEETPLPTVRVVLCAMDPYPNMANDGMPQAMGMAFSVRPGVTIPSSLKNIFKELANSIDGFATPSSGLLLPWAKQGVLLLNQCLTVRPGQPGSHSELWLGFIMRVVNAVLEKNPNCVFMLLGKDAQKLKRLLNGRGRTVETSHPSGLSAHRGFIGSKCFVKVNEILKETGQKRLIGDYNNIK